MTPENQQIEIEKACGWTFVPSRDIQTEHGQKAVPESWCHEEGQIVWDKSELPNYLHDLNAMNGAEMTLTDEQYQKFEDYLFDACDRETLPPKWIRWGSAKAAVRARAFLQAIEKWEEEGE